LASGEIFNDDNLEFEDVSILADGAGAIVDISVAESSAGGGF
jgi:hypothetical protein